MRRKSEEQTMGIFLTEKEIEQVFNTRKRDRFELLQTTKKTTFEFYVTSDEKDVFLQWIEILSRVEFGVDVNLDDIHVKGFTTDHKKFNEELRYEACGDLVFRIKVSGSKKDINRWNDNLCCIAKFLRGNYDVTHFKTIENKG